MSETRFMQRRRTAVDTSELPDAIRDAARAMNIFRWENEHGLTVASVQAYLLQLLERDDDE